MGDRDMLHKFFEFYLRMLNDTTARTVAQFQGTPHPLTAGALYGEVTTLFGTYNPGDWGCGSPVPKPDGASNNPYIRFHWTGGLELSLMILDSFEFSGDRAEAKRFLPICFAVVEGFRQRFPNVDPVTGLTDMFPAQALVPTLLNNSCYLGHSCGDRSHTQTVAITDNLISAIINQHVIFKTNHY